MSSTAAAPTASPSVLPSLPTSLSIKLSADNYLVWKLQFEPLLTSHDLYGHVDGTSMAPAALTEAGAANPDFATWRRRDQFVLAWIISSITESALHTLVGVTTAHAAWKALAAAYGTGSTSQIRSLKTQLGALRQGSDTIAVYLHRSKSIFDRLRSLGASVEEGDFIDNILHGLNPAYKDFTRSLRHRPNPASYLEVHGLLLAEEADLSVEAADVSLGPQSHYSRGAQQRPRQRRSGSFRPPSAGRGSYAGPHTFQPGQPTTQTQARFPGQLDASAAPFLLGPAQMRLLHSRNQQRPSSFPSSFGQRGQLICFNCQGAGHHFRYCPSPRQPGSTLPPVANYATTPHQAAQEFWTLDSGANHHLTNDLDNLALHSGYHGTEQVQISDGPSDAPAVVQRPE
ncbi:Retrovirus-related Pol polyprotein from transposon RE1 [Linum perenne]